VELTSENLKRGNELAERCRTLNQKFVAVIPRLSNEEILAELLAVNDLLHKSLDRFSTWGKQSKSKGKETAAPNGTPLSAPAVIESPPPVVPPPTSNDSPDDLLTVPSKSSVITDEFGEFILADLNEALAASEESDRERIAFDALRKEEEFTEYRTPAPVEDDDDDFPDFKLVSNSTDNGFYILIFLRFLQPASDPPPLVSSSGKTGVLLKNIFPIPQFDEEKTAAWLAEMEEKVKQEAISALGSEGSVKNVIVEEHEVRFNSSLCLGASSVRQPPSASSVLFRVACM